MFGKKKDQQGNGEEEAEKSKKERDLKRKEKLAQVLMQVDGVKPKKKGGRSKTTAKD